MNTTDPSGASQCGPCSRGFPLVLAVALAIGIPAALLLSGNRDEPQSANSPATENSGQAAWIPAPAPEGQTVSLVIDFGNGARRDFDALPWREGMTVGGLLRAASDFRPPVTWSATGTGDQAFLTSLEGVAGGGPGGRYWVYSINGVSGDRSFEVAELPAGAAVLWAFKKPE